MEVVVVGAGYVGLVTAVTLSILGHRVTCVDVNSERIAMLKAGKSPFYEPGLEEVLAREIAAGRLLFTADLAEAVGNADCVILCVGTPSTASGAADLTDLMHAVDDIASVVKRPLYLVIKSTVPVGTNRRVVERLQQWQVAMPGGLKRSVAELITVVSNPEFLREGSALHDSLHPDRIVVGTTSKQAIIDMQLLYRGLDAPFLAVSPEEAELIKYASNAFLAMKISFANSLADFCEVWGADIRVVTKGMGMDTRIGSQFMQAGLGFGGSCFPKDVRALLYQYQAANLYGGFLQETLRVNQARITRSVNKLKRALGSLLGRKIAILGLAFKPGTDDVRESPSLYLLQALLDEGCQIKAYDPQAIPGARRLFPDVEYCASSLEAVQDADAVVVATDWPEFKELPWDQILARMRGRVVLDARNLYEREVLEKAGALYLGLGVPDGMVERRPA